VEQAGEPHGGLTTFSFEDVGAGKLCYSAPILIKSAQGDVVDTYDPTVLVSANDKKIISSYPTHLVDRCG
jgi:hypothetical protein